MGFLVTAVVTVVVVGLTWWFFSRSTKDERRQDDDVSYSNPGNNHDHLKHKHRTREFANEEVRRMQRQGYGESERLNVYYNRELDGWYVGRRQW
jgi:hypothetical protein